jgi:hypothetical protein
MTLITKADEGRYFVNRGGRIGVIEFVARQNSTLDPVVVYLFADESSEHETICLTCLGRLFNDTEQQSSYDIIRLLPKPESK